MNTSWRRCGLQLFKPVKFFANGPFGGDWEGFVAWEGSGVTNDERNGLKNASSNPEAASLLAESMPSSGGTTLFCSALQHCLVHVG